MATALIGPMTYLSHLALSRFICASPRRGEGITVVAESYFGPAAGKGITLLYFLAIFPIVLIYGVGITNTVDSFLANQLGMGHVPRPLLAFVLIGLMMLVMVFGERSMLAVSGILVYPLIATLFVLSVCLIPSWELSGFGTVPSADSLLKVSWLVIPVLVFAFDHSPSISQFSLAMQRAYGPRAARNADVVLRYTALLLVIFTMFFVWSCSLALGPDGLIAARDSKLPVLSYLANVRQEPFISYAGPFLAIAAIGSSFFGHYLVAGEGAAGLVRSARPDASQRAVRAGVTAFIFLSTWAAAVINPAILSLIESLGGPVIAAILYLMPMIAIHRVPALAQYRGRLSNVFVTVAGLVAISGIFFSLVR